jgi:hypothetical protein
LVWDFNDVVALLGWKHGLAALRLFNILLLNKILIKFIQLVEIILTRLSSLLLLLITEELLLGMLVFDCGAYFAAGITFSPRLFLLLLFIVVLFSRTHAIVGLSKRVTFMILHFSALAMASPLLFANVTFDGSTKTFQFLNSTSEFGISGRFLSFLEWVIILMPCGVKISFAIRSRQIITLWVMCNLNNNVKGNTLFRM